MKKLVLITVLCLFFNCRAEIRSTIAQQTPDVIWSILICTLEQRALEFQKLFSKLQEQIKQADLPDVVEIIYFKDDRENAIGYKRNALVQKAQGTYICFIDDDDDIHSNYIQMIYEQLCNEPDCVSLHGIITFNGQHPRHFIHSISYDHYFEKDGVFYRPPNHLNPIKKEIAQQFLFPETNWQEDTDWALQIAHSGLLKTEAYIREPYYFYHYVTDKTK